MSGLEIAGVVLGSIPLAIAALEHYMDGIRAIKHWQNYARELKSLKRNLNTERVKFQNVCETLLVGIVPSSKIEAMIDDPFGAQWHEGEMSRKLRVRLWRSFKLFEETVQDMEEAIKELMKRLDLGIGGKIKWTESATIVRELKRASFMFKRADYQHLLSRIKDANTNLETLTTQNISLEQERRGRGQGRWFKLAREISKSVYNALRSGFVCKCPESHNVNLELAPHPDITPHDDEERLVRDLRFRIALSYSPEWHWVVVRPAEVPDVSGLTTSTLSYPTTSRKKSVKFSMSATSSTIESKPMTMRHVQASNSTVTELHSTGSVVGMSNNSSTPKELVDLCFAIKAAQKQKKGDCYGFLMDQSSQRYQKYGVYPLEPGNNSDTWSTVSLRNILKDRTANQPPLTYTDKLYLAVVISSSVLQFYQTPWLPGILTADDIFFIQEDDVPFYKQAFIAKKLPEVVPAPLATKPIPIIRNQVLLSLGILLTELIFGETLSTLRSPEDTLAANCTANILTDYMTATRLVNRIYQMAGGNYSSAVRRCVHCEFNYQNPSLEDDGFRQDVYDGVVALLVEDLENSKKSMS